MKILLTAINAKYIHSNLAIQCLRAYAKDYKQQIKLIEFTINNYADDLLQAIYKEKPDLIGFSCYIWNITMIEQLCVELRKLLPETKLWLGGPEVSYDAGKHLEAVQAVDGIMIGEGEETFKELLDYYIKDKLLINQIKGIAFKDSARKKDDQNKEEVSLTNTITITPLRTEFDLSSLPFPYENIGDFKNKIIYYETSRGCPYSCSYCLSSVDKKVRLRDIDLVKEELGIFLMNKVPQIKFVDRTFNCNKAHALAIWKYIKENDNGITNFHFEISADILGEEELNLLAQMRQGLVQLEIGVQSTNRDTVEAIRRRMDFNKLSVIVNQIHKPRNIHQHLDLIAGLPYEDLESFKRSFNQVYALWPDQFQLGFLKILKGSAMHEESGKWGIVYKSTAPYEVLYTKWLSYDEILTLKNVEEMVEIYYNSAQFESAIKYLEHYFDTPFDLYLVLGNYYERKGFKGINHARMGRYEILLKFFEEVTAGRMDKDSHLRAFKSVLVHDLYLRENLKSRPSFAEDYELYKKRYRDFYQDTQTISHYLMLEETYQKPEQLKQYLHLEHYNIDVEETVKTGEIIQKDQFVLYDYMHRNPLTSQAKAILINL